MQMQPSVGISVVQDSHEPANKMPGISTRSKAIGGTRGAGGLDSPEVSDGVCNYIINLTNLTI